MQISPLGSRLVSALSIPIAKNGSIPLLQSRQCSSKTSKPPDHFTMQPPSKITVCKMYSSQYLRICEIINKKRVNLSTPSHVPTYEDGCCVEALVHVLVEEVGNPGQEGEGSDVTQGGGDRGRHVVRVHLQNPA
jgi:hypothetical protein